MSIRVNNHVNRKNQLSPSAAVHKPSKPEVKPIPVKKPKDPLQGMREANEHERLRNLAVKAKELENAVPPEPTASSSEKSPPETAKTEHEPEQQSTPLDSSPEVHQSTEPPPEPNLYSRPAPRGPPRSTSGGGGQKWMYYAAALTLAGAGFISLHFHSQAGQPTDHKRPKRPVPTHSSQCNQGNSSTQGIFQRSVFHFGRRFRGIWRRGDYGSW